ncbi:uncharacterized protein LOC116212174 [Punica granatum]|uniref:Uncharacterized protein LOC116212174 n=2 Tax=Punica granatum TaxID=22663 RepID=A0A6P8E561_PUNGR|nr:uncharacterized protein LOC116212174 [Punica granatum]
MGRVRTKTVKKSSRQVIERYYSKMTLDFHTNKKILEEVAIIPSKRLRNKIAGFSTHLMKRIQKGPVRGISLKLQEEERERRMDFVPDESAIRTDEIKVDKETLEMLAALGMKDNIPGLIEIEPQAMPVQSFGRRGRYPEMGRVRTKTVKKSSRQVIERYYSKMTLDFHTNKKILEEVAIIPSKRLRNKIAGFSTHLMKRIQKGPVRGISLKLQEEERERRMDFVPDESAIRTDEIKVDKETLEMLAALGMKDNIPGLVEIEPQAMPVQSFGRRGRY